MQKAQKPPNPGGRAPARSVAVACINRNTRMRNAKNSGDLMARQRKLTVMIAGIEKPQSKVFGTRAPASLISSRQSAVSGER